jgi:hypothetical protein
VGIRGVDRGQDDLQALLLVVESEPDVDQGELDRSVRQLRKEIKDLDIESIVPVSADSVPPRTKGVDSSNLGALLITLSATGGIFAMLIETVRDWLSRHASARRISVTIDDDTITLEKSSTQERNALIDAYIRRHEAR